MSPASLYWCEVKCNLNASIWQKSTQRHCKEKVHFIFFPLFPKRKVIFKEALYFPLTFLQTLSCGLVGKGSFQKNRFDSEHSAMF